MRTLRSPTGTSPQDKVSVTCAPILCWGVGIQTTPPSSVTSPDSPDGGWFATGLHRTFDGLTLLLYWNNSVMFFLSLPVWTTTIVW